MPRERSGGSGGASLAARFSTFPSAMRFKSVRLALLPALLLLARPCAAEETSFEKDRRAILSMAGEFQVGFHFRETLSLHRDYAIREKAYNEKAFETVKVVEDEGRRIVLQHLLQVGPTVVKHWAQIWTYEDAEILEFQGHRTWVAKTVPEAEAKGKWTQRVTQVDDSPRYEGIGAWVHFGDSSEWTATANRPLPRREHTKRKDYDLLVVTNRHTVTPRGWFHEQDNAKWVKRDGGEYPLCREVGLNDYIRVEGHDFAKADEYWEKTSSFWKDVRLVWDELSPLEGRIELLSKSDEGRIFDVVGDLADDAESGDAPAIDEIRRTLKSFVVASGAKP